MGFADDCYNNISIIDPLVSKPAVFCYNFGGAFLALSSTLVANSVLGFVNVYCKCFIVKQYRVNSVGCQFLSERATYNLYITVSNITPFIQWYKARVTICI